MNPGTKTIAHPVDFFERAAERSNISKPSEWSARANHQILAARSNNKSKSLKNQPTILKRPTTLTKTRQLNQTLQRNRGNVRPLLPLSDIQSDFSQSTSHAPTVKEKPRKQKSAIGRIL